MPGRDLSANEAMRDVGFLFAGQLSDEHASGLRPGISGDRRGALRRSVTRVDGLVPPAGSAQQDSGTVSGGGQRASGTGRADGSVVGTACSPGIDAGPHFDRAIPEAGYAWWYVDAISDDRQHALTVIALLGSVFSPYYRRARLSGAADPLNHCAFNVALYGPNGKRWAMTERGRDSLSRSRSVLVLHRSSLSLESDHLALSIDEIGTPIPRRIKGKVRLYPHFAGRQAYAIDHAGRHLWRPIAPSARVEVEMTSPSLRWSGQGYFDHNRGEAPLCLLYTSPSPRD